MSLILEALRKSEADRRRGEVPNVYAELPPSARTSQAPIPTWAWWLLAGAMLLVALWFVRGMTSHEPAPKLVSAKPAVIIPASHRPTLPSVSRLSPSPMAVPAPAPSAGSEIVSPVREATTNVAQPAIDAAHAPRATPPVATAVAKPADAGILQLSELSIEERKALPPLKLSMHMWNDDPAQRFIIIDGNRLHEGDRAGDAVVTAITVDGVLLDWNGRQLKVPIR